MADIVSLVGGLVSLGLQLYDKADKYIETIRDRSDDVGSFVRQMDALKQALVYIDASVKSGNVQHANPAVAKALEVCKAELALLEGHLVEEEAALASMAGRSGLGDKIKNVSRLLTYPRRREKIGKLEVRVERSTVALGAVMDCLGR